MSDELNITFKAVDRLTKPMERLKERIDTMTFAGHTFKGAPGSNFKAPDLTRIKQDELDIDRVLVNPLDMPELEATFGRESALDDSIPVFGNVKVTPSSVVPVGKVFAIKKSVDIEGFGGLPIIGDSIGFGGHDWTADRWFSNLEIERGYTIEPGARITWKPKRRRGGRRARMRDAQTRKMARRRRERTPSKHGPLKRLPDRRVSTQPFINTSVVA